MVLTQRRQPSPCWGAAGEPLPQRKWLLLEKLRRGRENGEWEPPPKVSLGIDGVIADTMQTAFLVKQGGQKTNGAAKPLSRAQTYTQLPLLRILFLLQQRLPRQGHRHTPQAADRQKEEGERGC